MFDQMKAYVGGEGNVGEYEYEINVIEHVEIYLACVTGDTELEKVSFGSLDEMQKVGEALVKIAKMMKNQ